MIWEVASEVSDDRADEVVMEMFGFGIGAYYVVDSRRVFVLIVVS
jgi:hypothetical protein